MHFFKLHFILFFFCILMLPVITTSAEAKNKRLDKKIVETATMLAKDHEASLASRKAMPLDDFKAKWAVFVAELDKNYQGHTVKLKTFGTEVGIRNGFSSCLNGSNRDLS